MLDDEAARALVRRVHLGDREALDELVRAFLPGVYGFFIRFFRDREVASDLTQEVFLRVHAKLGTYKPRFSFRSWIYAIAWNLARDRLRRKARSVSVGPLVEDDHLDHSGNGNGGEAAALSTERREWMNRALGRLTASQRAVLMLREFEGLSYEEMARLLGWKIGTVKSRLNRARLELKATLLEMLPNAANDLAAFDDGNG